MNRRNSTQLDAMWRQVVWRYQTEEAREAARLASAEAQLARARELPVPPADVDAWVDGALRKSPPPAAGVAAESGARRKRTPWWIAAAAAVTLISLTVTLWPEERNPRETLTVGDALVVMAEPGRRAEVRRSALFKTASIARDAIVTLRGVAAGGSDVAAAAQAELSWLERVIAGAVPAEPIPVAALRATDADLRAMKLLLRSASSSESQRREIIEDLSAIAGRCYVALGDVARDLEADAAVAAKSLSDLVTMR